ncbi:MAG: bifunctional methylenetetrahydrofolate dehydrogenase/methenyltetrahydrofolate cyclohydrolase FolD [Candidatus Muirbacterium halophilum]|nr:bifunctional methylenetetrahydrofolate dehydrogenase/methenyltetrahydrofolate cyclohydrolase FolD [Candidatus Muirbacterium halophilum]MCK9476043.1 bifunctional methylenetetrahydrofolate dehydrogenase/methenyltetrahydrofolate cyclohydrolase FolD [Candidatus Muirbacterium halophilum]
MQILDGKVTAKKIRQDLKQKIAELTKKPGLAVVIVGDNKASEQYVNMKKKACENTGIVSFSHVLGQKTTQNELIKLIDKLNNDDSVDGILVQLPLPEHINEDLILERIFPSKDVDGFHPVNVGKLLQNKPCFKSCTPFGIIKLLEEYNIEISGKRVAVLGRSNIVGKPMAIMLIHKNATVTVCHSKTTNIKEICRNSDIIISAIGKANFVKEDMVKEKAVIVDVGTNFINGKLCGDVDFENVINKVSYITPVPGGVGPMTIATLLYNTYEAYKINKGCV